MVIVSLVFLGTVQAISNKTIATTQVTPTTAIVSCSVLANEADCTNQDPVTQNCTVHAFTVATSYIKDSNGNRIGEADLRASTACESNWTLVKMYNSCGGTIIRVSVKRPGQMYQGNTYPSIEVPDTVTNPGCMSNYTTYTKMVYTPGNVAAQACASIDGSGESCTELI